jgi:mRNA-degrading endonuclease YafQ of YafQ-DinJ toxin-antitoxin module
MFTTEFSVENPESVSHKVGEFWSCRVTGDIRIIWEYKDGELVLLLLKIGGHNTVY